jgi:hypothetical protein
MKWWFISFADEHRFRGCCFVQAEDGMEAIRVSIERGCNAGPDTSVQTHSVKEEDLPDASDRYRLLSGRELDAIKRARLR